MEDLCKKQADGLVEPVEELCEEVETVRGFCYLGDKVNASTSGGCEAAVPARARIGWLGEVQGMWRVAEVKKILPEGERKGLSELCKSGDVIWE